LTVKFGQLQKGGAISEDLVTHYRVHLTTECGLVLGHVDVPKSSSTSTCCDAERYSVTMTGTPAAGVAAGVKYAVIKARSSSGAFVDDGGVKLTVTDSGAGGGVAQASGAETAAALPLAGAFAAAAAWALA